MKKNLFIIIALLFTISLQAQRIVHDQINEYNKRIINTSWVRVNWDSDANKLEASMMLEGDDKSILLNWQCDDMVGVERDAEILLSFADSSKVVLQNKAFSVSGLGKITTKSVSSTKMGIQIDAKGKFEELKEKELIEILINTTSGEISFPVSRKESSVLKKMYEVFDKQCRKEK